MGYIDLHSKPFASSTISKLELFEEYFEAWLPTFIMTPITMNKEIHVFDLFAGSGYDKNGLEGSPVRFLQKTLHFENLIQKRGKKIVFHFNEFEPNVNNQNKFKLLKKSCNDFFEANKTLKDYCEINFYNEDFEVVFNKIYNLIDTHPSLVYLDQNGIKFLRMDYLRKLEKSKRTDFIYFLSSSYVWRFSEQKEFQKYLDIDIKTLKTSGYKKIHRTITKHLQNKIGEDSKLKLYPFSLLKGSNIHGLIFGATHYLAVDKFLNLAWKRNSKNGDANFDIDGEEANMQLSMFEDQKPTKIEKFKFNLKEKILKEKIVNNKQALIYSYRNGHISKHASDLIKELNKMKIISYDSPTSKVNYNAVFKNEIIVQFKLRKNG